MLLQILLSISTALLPVSAHFSINYPAGRDTSAENLGNGPCGGSDAPSAERTRVSTTSLTVDLEMGHDQKAVQLLLGLGDNPGSNFNITLLQTFRQEGFGQFCLRDVPVPSDVGIVDGTNATLQVVTNGDPIGGLYNCADITFTTGTVDSPAQCANGTGVTASPFPSEAANRNANESTSEGQPQDGSSSENGNPTSSTTGSAGTATGEATAARVGWVMLGAAVLGAFSFL